MNKQEAIELLLKSGSLTQRIITILFPQYEIEFMYHSTARQFFIDSKFNDKKITFWSTDNILQIRHGDDIIEFKAKLPEDEIDPRSNLPKSKINFQNNILQLEQYENDKVFKYVVICDSTIIATVYYNKEGKLLNSIIYDNTYIERFEYFEQSYQRIHIYPENVTIDILGNTSIPNVRSFVFITKFLDYKNVLQVYPKEFYGQTYQYYGDDYIEVDTVMYTSTEKYLFERKGKPEEKDIIRNLEYFK